MKEALMTFAFFFTFLVAYNIAKSIVDYYKHRDLD